MVGHNGWRCEAAPVAFLVAALLVAALATAPMPARAQVGDAFTVRGVPVDATAENASAARIKAVADAQRRALTRVFERMTLSEDVRKLPRVNDRAIEGLVLAFEVDKERTSAVRYLAELTVRFNADRIRALLRQSGVRFAETRGRPVLILPVYQDAAAALLWEESNPWRIAWSQVPLDDALLPMIVPIGDITDADAIDGAAALAGDTTRLGAIAARYRAAEVVVAVAKLVDKPGNKDVLEIGFTRYGASVQAGPALAPAVVDSAGAVEKRLAVAAREMARRLDDDWKRANIATFGSEQQVSMSMPLSGLEELVEARRRLAELPSIRRVEINALTRKLARLTVTYTGDPQQLRAALAQKDMTLTQAASDWELSMTRGGIDAPPASAPNTPAQAAAPPKAAPEPKSPQ